MLFCTYDDDDDEMLHSDIWTIYHTAAAAELYMRKESERLSESNDTEIR